jgi:hypothetical protein
MEYLSSTWNALVKLDNDLGRYLAVKDGVMCPICKVRSLKSETEARVGRIGFDSKV